MALDFSKPVQTRSGLKVTILTTEARSNWPVAGLIHDQGADTLTCWTNDGLHQFGGGAHKFDLVQVPETVKRYLPVYDDGSVGNHLAGPALRGYASACSTLEDTDPHARYILELVYLGKRLESVGIIRRGEVTP